MVTEGLFALLCAGAVVSAGPTDTITQPSPDNRDTAVNSVLAVQTALQQGREHLLHNDFKSAVYVLESQLARINGNRVYLALLQDAYRAYVKELRLAKQEATAQIYLDRLRILDPGSVLDKTLSPPVALAKPAAPPAQPQAKVRAKSEEETSDPFHSSRAAARPSTAAGDLLARADGEFALRRYQEARLLYEQAYGLDRQMADASRERWAYCKLSHVVEVMNRPSAPTADLEGEVRLAMSLAPRLEEHGKSLLVELQKRRVRPAIAETPRASVNVAVRHFDRNHEGLACAEPANFRIFHNQARDLVEKIARTAETTREDMQRKWFGDVCPEWSPKCELFMHATGQEYSRATGVPGSSPGHSSIRMEAGRVVFRRIDLHCDEPNLLTAVLPHETTHVVLAGQFGDAPVPRWADEGMAVLTEPREKVERHLHNLTRCRQEGQYFSLRQLMHLQDYPDPRSISAFYAQSVSLVDFLANEKGPRTFAEFLREGLKGGYEPALQRYYGLRTFEELEQRWTQQAFRPGTLGKVADRR